ncbi:hypothetical protein [Saccharothrix syringae]|uniref:Uncharacterized protein n=1 Tax=Saccharothrix syringae TaxID=103733 RepID=A0A5Q0HD65_SACSY|nr:hypothetical protein [Saccharothrix syringae]QFZ23905.1 hypothetical protein EKG83_46430 [Saccharothrix syringae]
MAQRRIGGAGGGSSKGSGGGSGGGSRRKSSAGVVAAGAVVAIMAASTGGGGAAGPAADVTGPDTRKTDGKRSARDGDLDDAFARLGKRVRSRVTRHDAECLGHSYKQVREFFAHTPCTGLDRLVLAVDDATGTAVVSVAWVTFPDRGRADRFKRLVDVPGTGDIRPLGSTALGLAEVTFTAAHYWSETRGASVTVAEAEPAAGSVDPGALDALAEVAAQLPRP